MHGNTGSRGLFKWGAINGREYQPGEERSGLDREFELLVTHSSGSKTSNIKKVLINIEWVNEKLNEKNKGFSKFGISKIA